MLTDRVEILRPCLASNLLHFDPEKYFYADFCARRTCVNFEYVGFRRIVITLWIRYHKKISSGGKSTLNRCIKKLLARYYCFRGCGARLIKVEKWWFWTTLNYCIFIWKKLLQPNYQFSWNTYRFLQCCKKSQKNFDFLKSYYNFRLSFVDYGSTVFDF